MNIEESGRLLGRIQVIDNRRVDEATILAWHELVDDIAFDVAVEAVRLHFRESTAYLVPAHVRQNADRIIGATEFAEDEHGNLLEPDQPALQAQARLMAARRAIGGAS